MDDIITNIKNKLIVYKTTEKLPIEVIQEIQDVLLNKRKIEDFESLLNKVESLIKKA